MQYAKQNQIMLIFFSLLHTQIPHQLVGVPLNYNVTLECFTEAHPTSLNYWTREDGNMIHDSKKYRCVWNHLVCLVRSRDGYDFYKKSRVIIP